MKSNSIDLKKLFASSDSSTKEVSDRVSYSKKTLINLSRNPPCRSRPDCLSEDCLGNDGLWDPEKWHLSLGGSEPNDGARKSIDMSEVREESNVVLGPQRRSFQGGCHVASKEKVPSSSYSRSALSSTSSKLSERGTKSSYQQDHEPLKRFHSLQNGSSDWSRKDSENKKYYDKLEPSYSRKTRHSDYKRYVPPNKKYSDMGYREDNHYEESEPEWISYGPKSQSDTIELSGFDTGDDFSWMGRTIPMDDVPDRKKKHARPIEEGRDEVKSLPAEDDLTFEPADGREALEKDAGDDFLLEADDKPIVEESFVNGAAEAAGKEVDSDERASGEEPKVDQVRLPLDDGMFASTAAESEQSKESRFSRWFSYDPNSARDVNSYGDLISDSGVSIEQKLEELTSHIFKEEEEEDAFAPVLQQPVNQSEVVQAEPSHVSVPVQPNSTATSVDLRSADAFSRLIASIRATDKVKEEMQQRNEKMQALQSMMNVNKSRGFHLSSIESPTETAPKNVQSNLLKQQLEKQKDAYQQKIRQMEQQKQKSSPTMYSNADVHSMQMNQGGGGLPGFAMQSSSGRLHDAASDERAAATASFAAKLAGKPKDDSSKVPTNAALLERLYAKQSQPTQQQAVNEHNLMDEDTASLLNLHRLQASAQTDSKAKLKSYHPLSNAAGQNSLNNNSLAIAQMLTNAGVTEEQLKQLTLEQQELVISMVQNQYSGKDIGKLVNPDGGNTGKVPDARTALSGNVSPYAGGAKDLFSKSLPVAGGNRLTTATTNTSLSFLTDTSTALPVRSDVSAAQAVMSSGYQLQTATAAQTASAHARLLSRNLMHVQPATLVSPVVPLVSPNIAPRMLTHTLAAPPHLTPLVQSAPMAPPHPALLMQLQQQLYANQLAAAQQQQQQQQHHHNAALAAALQKQQLAAQLQQATDAMKLQHGVQNMRIGARAGTSDAANTDRSHFNNPLAQWFSSDILRQSQFPPVSQLTGQQTMKLSNVPHSVESLAHNAKQH